KWIAMIIQGQQQNSLAMKQHALHWLSQTPHICGLIDIIDQNLVFLLSYDDEEQFNEEIKTIQNQLSSGYLRPVFLGTIVESVTDIIKSYEQAKILETFIPSEHTPKQIYFANNYLKEILLFGTFDYERASALRGRILPKEILQDEVLIETLSTLVKNEYNREYTAKQLFIHRNTLRYRLLKIEEILKDSLSSLICQFWLKVAFEIEHVANVRSNCAPSTKTELIEQNS